MNVKAIIPFKPIDPKTRLSSVLTKEEREEFAGTMLGDVISAVKSCGCSVTILATSEYKFEGVMVSVKDEGLNESVNAQLKNSKTPVLIIMSDLPLADKNSLTRLLSTEKDIGIVPGLGGGTNLIFVKYPEKYHVEYYGYSFAKHLKAAEDAGLSVEIIDSMRLSTDVDEPSDLAELLIHGKGKAREWLLSHGFELLVENGRLKVKRYGKAIL